MKLRVTNTAAAAGVLGVEQKRLLSLHRELKMPDGTIQSASFSIRRTAKNRRWCLPRGGSSGSKSERGGPVNQSNRPDGSAGLMTWLCTAYAAGRVARLTVGMRELLVVTISVLTETTRKAPWPCRR